MITLRAYKRVDKCLEECEKTSEHSGSIRRTYAGLRFICVEQKEGLFSNSHLNNLLKTKLY